MVGNEEVDHEYVSILCSTQIGSPLQVYGMYCEPLWDRVTDPMKQTHTHTHPSHLHTKLHFNIFTWYEAKSERQTGPKDKSPPANKYSFGDLWPPRRQAKNMPITMETRSIKDRTRKSGHERVTGFASSNPIVWSSIILKL